MPSTSQLSCSERQIMVIVYELSEASAKVMEARLANPPGYPAIRATVHKLETKGFLVRREIDLKYDYYLLIDHQEAREPVL